MTDYFVTGSQLDANRLLLRIPGSRVHRPDFHHWSTTLDQCLDDLALSDALVIHTSDNPTAAIILGWWLHSTKGSIERTILIGHRENAWHWHPSIEHHNTWIDFLNAEANRTALDQVSASALRY